MVRLPLRKVVALLLTLAALLVGCQPAQREAAPPEQQTGEEPPSAAAPSTPQPPSPAAPVVSAPPVEPAPPPAPSRRPDVELRGVEVRVSQDQWEPVQPGATLPAQNVTLRFQFQEDLTPVELEDWIKRRFTGTLAVYSLPAAGVAEVTLPDLPSYLHFFTTTQGHVPMFFGDPPTLVLLDLATGSEKIIGEAPSSVWKASVSPDGRWAVLGAYAQPYGSEQVWLTELSTGERQLLPVKADEITGPFTWVEDQLLIPHGSTMQYWDLSARKAVPRSSAGFFWGPLSPDGRYLAGFSVSQIEKQVEPATVVIYDLKTGTEQSYPSIAGSLVRSCWIELSMAWDTSGNFLLIEDYVTIKAKGVVHLDRRTGEVSRKNQTTIPEPDYDRPRLGPSPNGWQVLNRGWGPLEGNSPSGERFKWGEGYPVGWMPDGTLVVVRWQNAEHRVKPGGDC